jgi:septum formation protein
LKLFLASASPRRVELLRQVGIPFKTVTPRISEEDEGSLSPQELVCLLARKKAEYVAGLLDEGIVLAADTAVLFRGQVFGKPSDNEDAARMLKLLSGDQHEVITGLALIDSASGRIDSDFLITRVWFEQLSEAEITAYVKTGEANDKAGAYGIQGLAALFVKKIDGCYFNVVGLPLNLLYEMLKNMQFPMWLSRKDDFNAE